MNSKHRALQPDRASPTPHPQPPTPPYGRLLVGLVGLAAGYIWADVRRMQRLAARAGLPYHPTGLRCTLTGPGTRGSLRYMALGDSTAHGIGARDPQHTPPYLLAQGLTEFYSPVTYANIAVSGATTADVQRTQIDQVPAFAPDLVTLFIGPNDVTHFRGKAAYLAEMHRLLSTLDAVPAVVVTNVVALRLSPLGSPLFRLLVELQGRRFNAALPPVVARHRAHLATVNPDLVHPFATHPDRYFAADGYHPNDAGYQVWADYLAPRVLATLRDFGF